MAGYYDTGTDIAAAYWIDDGISISRIDLHVTSYAQATGIYVDASGNVYISGFYKNGLAQNVAVYWKNGVRSGDLGVEGRATDIVVDSSDKVYIAGYYGTSPQRAVYWTDNGSAVSEIVLDGSGSAEATGISLSSGGTVYVSGSYGTIAAYWVDAGSGVVDLHDNAVSNAKDVVFDGSEVFVAGRYQNVSGQAAAAYWQSSGPSPVQLNTSTAQAYGIAIAAGNVYIAGDYIAAGPQRRAAWWLNSSVNQTILEGENSSYWTNAYDIRVDGADVYVAGTQTPASVEEAVYWKNGVLNPVEPGVESRGTALFLEP